jgi:hypothetical protein
MIRTRKEGAPQVVMMQEGFAVQGSAGDLIRSHEE